MDRMVVVGASAGGIEALREMVAEVPAAFAHPVLVVLHVAPYRESIVPQILARSGPLPAAHARDGEPLVGGRIYVAPPDHHLLVEGNALSVTRGPRENRFRPSIDALFRSAAYARRSGVVGVVLSGALDDGTSGLWSIKRMGGTTLVQHPHEARYPSMPVSALEHVDVDHVMSAREIGRMIAVLAPARDASTATADAALLARMALETAMARDGGGVRSGALALGERTDLTCPECRGALRRVDEGPLARYRCHTGHAFTANALLEGVMETSASLLWEAMRGCDEAAIILDEWASRMREAGDPAKGDLLDAGARHMEGRSEALKAMAMNRIPPPGAPPPPPWSAERHGSLRRDET